MLIKNRSGRIVDVSKEQADYMLRNNEGELVDETPPEPVKTVIEDNTCLFCGKVCVSPFGLKSHMRHCKKKS
jgi:hypothetical protein